MQVGDFDGSGNDDLLGWYPSLNQLWVMRRIGDTTDMKRWHVLDADPTQTEITAGDFNGDGLDDIFGRVLGTGKWILARSSARKFYNPKAAVRHPAQFSGPRPFGTSLLPPISIFL